MTQKKKTTFAKLNREQKLQDKRMEKQMRKDARKLAASEERDTATHATVASGADDVDDDARPRD